MYKRNHPSWIAQKMKEENLSFRKRFGQNFLIDDHALEHILEALALNGGENVLEIGPGLGALTERLLTREIQLYAVEIDRDLGRILGEDFPRENFHLIVEDVLKVNPMDLPEPLVIIGNLPYYITSAILMHFLESPLEIPRMVMMMQKEVAQRLTAEPGTKDYGILSVITQIYAKVEKLFDVGKNCFMPAPKVESTVVRLEPGKRESLDEKALEIIKAAFSQRRKTLLNSLGSAFDRETILEALKNAGIDPARRAESLTIEEYKNLIQLWPTPELLKCPDRH